MSIEKVGAILSVLLTAASLVVVILDVVNHPVWHGDGQA
jgi:hypothetical protein